MSLHAKKYYPRRMRRRWEDAVGLALAVFVALVAGVLISATSAHAAEVSYKQSFSVVTSSGTVQPAALVLSQDGRRAYVANRLDHSLVSFGIDAAGNWQKTSVVPESPGNGLAAPVQLGLSHDESRLYVLGNPDTLAEYAINAATGELTFKKLHANGTGSLIGLIEPAGIATSPDDAHVYVTSSGDHRVLVFARQADGDLAFVNSLQDGVGGVDGLGGADQIVISADGKSVYVSSPIEHSIATFARDPAGGALTFMNVLIDGASGVDGLFGAHAIAVSDDGAHVYVGGLGDDAIVVFQRDTTTGLLSPYKVYRNGGLNGVIALRLAPHRNHLYAVSINDNALVVFQRDPATGDLTLQDVLSDGIDNIDGLLEPLDLVVDAQNHYLYSIGTEQKIGQFEVANAPPVAVDDNAVATVGMTGAIDVLGNDTDPDAGEHLHVVRVTATPSTQGVVALIDGQVAYTPAAGVTIAEDSFRYTAADARGAEAEATVTVTINAPPVAMSDTVTTAINTPVTICVLANDSDADANFRDTLSIPSFDAISSQLGSVTAGHCGTSLHFLSSVDVKALTYTPPENFSGNDTFTYSVSDDRGGIATGTVTVTVGNGVGVSAITPAANSSRKKRGGGATDFALLALLAVMLAGGAHSRRARIS